MKILYITTISLTINTFFKPHIEMLVKKGCQVDIACNYSDLELDGLYSELGCKSYQIDFSRSPLSKDNIKAYGQLKAVIENGEYDIVHCHTPNASIITRLVCRKFRKKNGIKVFYTAHGFHFYKGAPKLNWAVYYPVEKFCSRFTDKLITINQEDYELAKSKFKAKQVCYVPGVGIDLSRFENVQVDKGAKRQEIGVPQDAMLLFSVGELNDNKNHQVMIKALARLDDPTIHYAIAGVGEKKEYLIKLAQELGVSEQVHFLGFRNDIFELNCCVDIFCFPSFREGLSASLMEAMASSLPCVVSHIRGNVDLIDDKGGALFDPHSDQSCANAISKVMKSDMQGIGMYNSDKAKNFGVLPVIDKVERIYFESN
ncbi:MAG: glycosyltransferase family 4 protein [Ruminococcus sp.]|nr:glycosyltransferase family 4 protein [Ruminococcus sp.]